ncbi:MAG: sensor histidine kinase [Ktedonobacterales bacterium]
MSSQIERLRTFSFNIGIFWQCVTFAFLLISLAVVFAPHPSLLLQPRGWLILLGVAAFGLWFRFGYRWLVLDDPEIFWAQLARGKAQVGYIRPVVYWAILLLINLGLIALDSGFRWMLWSVYGVAFSILPMPQALALIGAMCLILFYELGWLPQHNSVDSWLSFIIALSIFVVYSATAYLPFVLLRGRFERERMYQQLKASHRELAEAHRQLETSSERDRELAVLRERARIGRDMHDTLGHSLALIAVKLEAAQRLRAIDADRADHEIAATQAIARDALGELRATLTNLRSEHGVRAEHAPLGEELARLAGDAGARASWQVIADMAPDVGALDAHVHAALLRVGSEAISNVERHASARTVRLALVREGGAVALRIQDDGVGILTTNPPTSPSPVRQSVLTPAGRARDNSELRQVRDASTGTLEIRSPQGHYGISNMRERIAELGGCFSIGPAPDGCRGTLVEARIPLSSL